MPKKVTARNTISHVGYFSNTDEIPIDISLMKLIGQTTKYHFNTAFCRFAIFSQINAKTNPDEEAVMQMMPTIRLEVAPELG